MGGLGKKKINQKRGTRVKKCKKVQEMVKKCKKVQKKCEKMQESARKCEKVRFFAPPLRI